MPAKVEFADADSNPKRTERSFDPPKALLKWLVLHAKPRAGQVLSSDEHVRLRRERLLIRHDKEVIDRALADLDLGGTPARWCTFEGPTFPDAVIETPDALVVVEGKFTETGPTTHTTWMAGRHQMLRHLDGAWEHRGNRTVFGFFAVEGEESAPFAVPPIWQKAAQATRSDVALESSLPHRSDSERAAIGAAFVGVTTWQAIARAFDLPVGTLSRRT